MLEKLYHGTFVASVSVVGGGIGTIIVVLLVALLSLEMRRLGSLIPDER